MDGQPTEADAPGSLSNEAAESHSSLPLILLGVLALALAVWFGMTGNGRVYVSAEPGSAAEMSPAYVSSGDARLSVARTAGTWVAGLATLCIFSFLWRDNPAYKLAEAVVVGVSAAYWMVVAFWTMIVPNLLAPLFPALIQGWAVPGLSRTREPNWWLSLVPLLLGAMLLMRLAPKGQWMARWPLAFIIGTTAGLRLIGFLQADFLDQTAAAVAPIVVASESGIDWSGTFRAVLILAGTLSALAYFFFSAEHRGPLGAVSRVGVWVLMITFGAAFASTVMGRIALLAIRLEFLFDDWLWLIDPTGNRFE